MDKLAIDLAKAMATVRKERDIYGKVRWLYATNWVVSVLKKHGLLVDAGEFYKIAGFYDKEKSFEISGDGKSIKCLACTRTSHNVNDVTNRYCGHCHVFHEDHK